MKSIFNTILVLCLVSLLSGCAGIGVQVLQESEIPYQPVSENHVVISKFPPKGSFKTIAILTVEQLNGEAPLHTIGRLRAKAAALGADYLVLDGLASNTYFAPETVDTYNTGYSYGTVNPNYNSGYDVNAFNSSVASTVVNPAHNYSLLSISGRALKVVSGSNEPDLNGKSYLQIPETPKGSPTPVPKPRRTESTSPAPTETQPASNPSID